MSEPSGPHDIGGLEAGPVERTEKDTAYWEWQIDAMIRLALSKGLITDFAELRDGKGKSSQVQSKSTRSKVGAKPDSFEEIVVHRTKRNLSRNLRALGRRRIGKRQEQSENRRRGHPNR